MRLARILLTLSVFFLLAVAGTLQAQPSDPLPQTRAVIDSYVPDGNASAVVDALLSDIANWLRAGGDNAVLRDALEMTIPYQEGDAVVANIAYPGADRAAVVVNVPGPGIPTMAFIWQMDGRYAPFTLLPESISASPGGPFRHASGDMPGLGFALTDTTGDGISEITTTYVMSGASALIAVPVVYDMQAFPEVIFSATLISWAGPSTITPLLRDDGTTAFQLTYPHLYGSGFDHKLLNHPIGREVWAYDTAAGRYILESRRVDLDESVYGDITLEDRLRWEVNEGERLYRTGDFAAAIPVYEAVRAQADAEGWTPPDATTDWDALAAFRLMQLAALTGDDPAPLADELLSIYGETILGELVRAFVTAYGEGAAPNAAARAFAAMQTVDLATAVFNNEAFPLLFPVDARGVQYPAAGVVAYLQSNPAAQMNTLADDLTALGFEVIEVAMTETGDLSLTLTEPGIEEMMLQPTVFTQTVDGWRIQLTNADPDAWPVVGDFDN